MSAQKFEAFLAKLYVDDNARSRFLADPHREALNAGLTETECATLETIDFIGLELAAQSFARKRSAPPRKPAVNLPRGLGVYVRILIFKMFGRATSRNFLG
jgi:hypothetical protein